MIDNITLNKIVADPEQPRQEFDTIEMERLISSIDSKGIMVPLIVEEMKNGEYLVIDGERRFRAATELKLKEVPVKIVKKQSPSERMIMRFHLQDQHSNWSVFDRARAISFFKENQGLSNEETGELLGISRLTVTLWTGILELSKRSKKFIIDKRIPFSYASKIKMLAERYSEFCGYGVPEIEIKLLKKYEARAIRQMNDFAKINKVIDEGKNQKELVKYLDNVKMSTVNLLGETEIGVNIELDFLAYKARSLTSYINKVFSSKEIKKMSDFQKKCLQSLIDTVEKLV